MYDTTKPYKKEIIELIKTTWNTRYANVENGIVVNRKFRGKDFHHVDGIGTKGVYYWQKKLFDSAVMDALAMNLNDLAAERAIPYALTDHIMIPKDNKGYILEIVKSLVNECKERDIVILNGETAIHNNMDGLEISVNMVGFVKKPKPNKFNLGDILIGIESNGLHSNGFSKIRKLFKDKFRMEFITPTRDYIDKIFEIDKKININGMCHITGGAYIKLQDLLYNNNLQIRKNHILKPQDIFYEIYEKGVSDYEMYKTFNCGIGFILGINKKDENKFIDEMAGRFKCDVIGKITKGNGKIKIESQFSKRKIEF